MIVFNCAKCGSQVQVGDEYAGQSGQCPHCGAVVTIPVSAATGPAAMSPAGGDPPSAAFPPGPGATPPASAAVPPGAMPMPPFAPPPMPAKGNPQATAALVLGILSIILPMIGFLFATLAFVFGILGLGKGKPSRGMATAGLVLGAVGLLAQIGMISVLLPSLARARQLSTHSACMANMHAIGQGVALYSGSYQDEPPFPLLFNGGDPNARLDSAGAASVDKITNTNATNNFWLLIAANSAAPNHFKCPSDAGNTGIIQASDAPYGWTALSQCSYGMQYPYAGSTAGGKDNPAALDNEKLDPTMIIVADRNPSGSQPNHSDEVVVLRKDTTVKKYSGKDISQAGFENDDIYVNASGKPGGLPQSATDTSICPVPSR